LVKTDDFTTQIDNIISYFKESPPFIRVIAAPRGAGKSTILHYIASQLKPKRILICFITHQPAIIKGEADPAFGIGNDTLSKIVSDITEALLNFERGERKRTLVKQLKAWGIVNDEGSLDSKSATTFYFDMNRKRLSLLLKYIKSRRIRVFLAIDNYDKLDESKAIAFLKSDFAQPLFEDLQASGVSIVLSASLDWCHKVGIGDLSYLGKPTVLSSLNPIEASTMIQKRIAWKSSDNKRLFEPQAIVQITVREEGIPRNILETARLCLIKAAERKALFISEQLVQEIIRNSEQVTGEYYRVIKKEPSALAGFFTLSFVARETDPDCFRTILQGLLDIIEGRQPAREAEEQLRKHKLLYLAEKAIPLDQKQNYLASDIQSLLKTVARKFPLSLFVDWLAAGEPAFFFIPDSEQQLVDSTIDEQFNLLRSAFRREEIKLPLIEAYNAFKSWTSQIDQGDYDIQDLLENIWSSLWGLSICAYYAETVVSQKKLDLKKPTYEIIETFLLSHNDFSRYMPDFVTVHQYYVLIEKGVQIDRSLVDGLNKRMFETISALLDISMVVLPYLRTIGIPLPTFKVRNAQELDQKLSPYLKGEEKYVYLFIDNISIDDFLMLSWVSKNYVYALFFGKKTFSAELKFDLYRDTTVIPDFLPSYIQKSDPLKTSSDILQVPQFIANEVSIRNLSNGLLLKYYNAFEFCNSLIRFAANQPVFIKVFGKRNTIDIALTVDKDVVLGSVDFSEPKFNSPLPLANKGAFFNVQPLKRSSRLFISYSSQDRQFVDRLVGDLRKNHVKVWIDTWEIKLGDSIIDKISQGIQENDYIAVVLSQSSIRSGWVKRELAASIIRELEEKRVIILPLLIQKCEVPPLISDKKRANFVTDYQEALQELISRLTD
jgi:hypothetical protein